MTKINFVAFGLLGLYLIVLTLTLYNGYQQRTTQLALCSLKGDLASREFQGANYLAKHPQKFILGIPRATLVQNLENEQRTLNALRGLHC